MPPSLQLRLECRLLGLTSQACYCVVGLLWVSSIVARSLAKLLWLPLDSAVCNAIFRQTIYRCGAKTFAIKLQNREIEKIEM